MADRTQLERVLASQRFISRRSVRRPLGVPAAAPRGSSLAPALGQPGGAGLAGHPLAGSVPAAAFCQRRPSPRAPPPLFLPEGRRAEGSAARQGPGQCRHVRGAVLALESTLRPASGPVLSASSGRLLSPPSHRRPGPPRPQTTPLSTRRPRSAAEHGSTTALAVGRHGPAAAAGLSWVQQWHRRDGRTLGPGVPGPARPADTPQPGFSPVSAGRAGPGLDWFLAPQPAVGVGACFMDGTSSDPATGTPADRAPCQSLLASSPLKRQEVWSHLAKHLGGVCSGPSLEA